MKKLLILINAMVIILLVFGVLASCTPKANEPVIIRYQTVGTPEDQLVVIQAGVDKINERLSGRYTIDLHTTEIVKFIESLDGVRTNSIEMAGFPLGPFASVDNRFALLNLPFIVDSYEGHIDSLPKFKVKYDELMQENYNQKILGYWCVTPLEISCAKRPVKTMDDWKGLLVQAIDPSATAIIDAMGATPIPIPHFEGYSALQKGVVDATIQANDYVLSAHLYEVVKYLTVCNITGASMVVSDINLDVWKAMPKDVQTVFEEEWEALSQEMNAMMVKDSDRYTRALADEGVDIYYLDKAERVKWQEATQPFCDSMIAESGEFGEEIAKIFEEANEKFPYKY